MSLPVVILAGGLATRLRPLTEKIPKALVKVAGRPFLEHQIELIKRNAIAEVILCVGYLGEMIEERYRAGETLGVRVTFRLIWLTLSRVFPGRENLQDTK